MSLKNILCVAAMAALTASPAFADPGVSIDLVRNGSGIAQLDANGDWQWEVHVDTDATGSVATELDFDFTSAGLLGGAVGNATVFDTPNPSGTALAWVTRDGDGVVGFQTSAGNAQATAAMGSSTEPAGSYLLATFTTDGPSTAGSLTSAVDASGIVAQLGTNYAASASASATAIRGDVNLDGNVNFQDAAIVSGNFNKAVTRGWATGDFTGDGNVNFQDAGVLSGNFNASGTAPSAGAGAAPEPTALALLMLAGSSACAARRRR